MRRLFTTPNLFFARMSGAILLLAVATQTGFGQTPVNPTTEQNKGIKITLLDANDKILQSFVLPVDEAASENAVLAKTFKQAFTAKDSFKIKVENQTARRWSFFLHNAGPGKGCYSVLPTADFADTPIIRDADIPVESLVPLGSTVSVKLPARSGEQKFAILASPSAAKLRSVFMSVEFLAGMTTGRGEPNKGDLSAIDALELKQGNSMGRAVGRDLTSSELKQGTPKGKPLSRESTSRRGSRITITLGNIYSQSGDALKSADYYDSLLLIAGCRFQDDRPSKIPFNALAIGWLNNQGLANYQTGTLGAAKANYEEALRKLKEFRSTDSKPHLAEEVVVLTNLAQVYATLDDQREAIKIYQQALDILPNVTEDEEPDEVKQNRYVAIYNGFGTSYEDTGDFKTARKHYEAALAIETRLDLKASAGITLNSLARLAAEEKDFTLSEKLFNQAKSLSIETGNQAGIASAHNNLGWLYVRLKKYEDAREAFFSSSDIFRRLKNRTAQATALGNLMFVENLLQHPRLAVFYGKQAINLLQ
ncbi:MAG: tetratricopeptide repeat protein, partial [Acidobacteria bacterium]|nr:tetratricopeptide repeat protein [Acidobacteriota bacterium]